MSQAAKTCAPGTATVRRYVADKAINAGDNAKQTAATADISYSSLYVNGKYGSKMVSVLRPRIDLEELVSEPRIAMLKASITARNAARVDNIVDDKEVDRLIERVRTLIASQKELTVIDEQMQLEKRAIGEHVKAGRRFEDIDTRRLNELRAALTQSQNRVWVLEEQLMPTVLSLPNILGPDVPSAGERLVVRSKRAEREKPLFKMLDHVKLSYINESVYGSIVGPSGVYFVGQTAKLHILASKGIASILRLNNFVDVTGLDFIKSAVVEATRSKKERHYQRDPLRIDRGHDAEPYTQQMHVVGNASLEALAAALVKLAAALSEQNVTRLFVAGTNYQANASLPRQRQAVQAFSTSGTADQACREMNHTLDVLWSFYDRLRISCRAVRCDATQLTDTESDATSIQVWTASRGDFVECARISYFADYLPKRLGVKDMYLVGASVSHNELVAALIENFQTEDGKIVIPDELAKLAL